MDKPHKKLKAWQLAMDIAADKVLERLIRSQERIVSNDKGNLLTSNP